MSEVQISEEFDNDDEIELDDPDALFKWINNKLDDEHESDNNDDKNIDGDDKIKKSDESFIYSEGASRREDINLATLMQSSDNIKKMMDELTIIINNIYDEFKGDRIERNDPVASGKKDKRRKSGSIVKSRPIFDHFKRIRLMELIEGMKLENEKNKNLLRQIQKQKASLLDDAQRRCYVEPRFTNAGMGYSSSYNLKYSTTNASVFYTKSEAVENCDSTTNASSSRVGPPNSSSSSASSSSAPSNSKYSNEVL